MRTREDLRKNGRLNILSQLSKTKYFNNLAKSLDDPSALKKLQFLLEDNEKRQKSKIDIKSQQLNDNIRNLIDLLPFEKLKELIIQSIIKENLQKLAGVQAQGSNSKLIKIEEVIESISEQIASQLDLVYSFKSKDPLASQQVNKQETPSTQNSDENETTLNSRNHSLGRQDSIQQPEQIEEFNDEQLDSVIKPKNSPHLAPNTKNSKSYADFLKSPKSNKIQQSSRTSSQYKIDSNRKLIDQISQKPTTNHQTDLIPSSRNLQVKQQKTQANPILKSGDKLGIIQKNFHNQKTTIQHDKSQELFSNLQSSRRLLQDNLKKYQTASITIEPLESVSSIGEKQQNQENRNLGKVQNPSSNHNQLLYDIATDKSSSLVRKILTSKGTIQKIGTSTNKLLQKLIRNKTTGNPSFNN
eukprot:403353822